MRVTVLGTGTSTGVPVPGCDCRVCTSDNPKNNRLRTSAFIELAAGKDSRSILIDTGPDLRAQALRAGIRRIDAVLYTHVHADHIFGIDDLRPFNFINKMSIPLYADERTAAELLSKFAYCFTPDPEYEGGAAPQLTLQTVVPYEPFSLFGCAIVPLLLYHGRMKVLGYRIGELAYLTDCSQIPDATRKQLQGVKVLILDALRMRPHRTHFTLEDAIKEVERIRPDRTYLIHISHEIDHEESNAFLRSRSSLPIELAWDGLVLDLHDTARIADTPSPPLEANEHRRG